MATIATPATDPIKAWADIKNQFAELRGFDVVGKKSGPRVPRTLNSDVKTLITLWTNALVFAGGEVVISSKSKTARPRWTKLAKKWERAAAQFSATIARNPPQAVFPDNERFWKATQKLAIGLSGIKSKVTHFKGFEAKDVVDAVVDAPRIIVKTIKKAPAAAGAVAEGVGEVAGKAVKGIGVGLGAGGLALAALAGFVLLSKRKGKR